MLQQPHHTENTERKDVERARRALTVINLLALDLMEVARKILYLEPYYLQRCKRFLSDEDEFNIENDDDAQGSGQICQNHSKLRMLRSMCDKEIQNFCYQVPCLLSELNEHLCRFLRVPLRPSTDKLEFNELRHKFNALCKTIGQQSDNIDTDDPYQVRLMQVMYSFRRVMDLYVTNAIHSNFSDENVLFTSLPTTVQLLNNQENVNPVNSTVDCIQQTSTEDSQSCNHHSTDISQSSAIKSFSDVLSQTKAIHSEQSGYEWFLEPITLLYCASSLISSTTSFSN